MTPDPIGLEGGVNLFEYTNNPVNYIDPLGLMSHEQWVKAKEKIDEIKKLNPAYGTKKNQFVCNKFAISVYSAAGISISGQASDIYLLSKREGIFFTDRSKLRPGDLIYFDYDNVNKINHVAIYEGLDASGNIVFSHMSSHGIRTDNENAFTGRPNKQRYGQAIFGFSTHK